jgi:hypothetical protein
LAAKAIPSSKRFAGTPLDSHVLMEMLLLAILLSLSGCIRRPVQPQFAERKCVKGTVEFRTFYCHSAEGKTELACDIPVAVCVVVDPQTNALTDIVVAKGQNPFDVDDDEAVAADKPKKHHKHAKKKEPEDEDHD